MAGGAKENLPGGSLRYQFVYISKSVCWIDVGIYIIYYCYMFRAAFCRWRAKGTPQGRNQIWVLTLVKAQGSFRTATKEVKKDPARSWLVDDLFDNVAFSRGFCICFRYVFSYIPGRGLIKRDKQGMVSPWVYDIRQLHGLLIGSHAGSTLRPTLTRPGLGLCWAPWWMRHSIKRDLSNHLPRVRSFRVQRDDWLAYFSGHLRAMAAMMVWEVVQCTERLSRHWGVRRFAVSLDICGRKKTALATLAWLRDLPHWSSMLKLWQSLACVNSILTAISIQTLVIRIAFSLARIETSLSSCSTIVTSVLHSKKEIWEPVLLMPGRRRGGVESCRTKTMRSIP